MDIASKYGAYILLLLLNKFYIFNEILSCIIWFVDRLLLEIGSDPCNKNKKLQTPYAAANDKKTRNAFRRFMEANPDKFNYQKVLFTIECYINNI